MTANGFRVSFGVDENVLILTVVIDGYIILTILKPV